MNTHSMQPDGCPCMLKGIIMSLKAPACHDVVWLQPIRPGLFRWMVSVGGCWRPVAVEQPMPKNALLSYLYEQATNNASLYKFYTESETEGMLGSYIYDEDGNVSIQGMLDFHCDDTQYDNKITFSQTIKDYVEGIGTYIKQFYDRIILSIEFPEGSHEVTLNKEGFFYDGGEVINLPALDTHLKNLFLFTCLLLGIDPETVDPDNPTVSVVSSVVTTVEPTIRNEVAYYLLKLSPEKKANGDVTITGTVDGTQLELWLKKYLDDNLNGWLIQFIEDDDFYKFIQNILPGILVEILPDLLPTILRPILINILPDILPDILSPILLVLLPDILKQIVDEGVITDYKATGVEVIEPKITAISGTITTEGEVNFTYNTLPSVKKHETTILLQATVNTTVRLPNTGNYIVVDGNTEYNLITGQWIEMNYLTIGDKVYVRSDVY